VSNFLAVATVTATLQKLLSGPVGADVPGATVTMVRPDGTASGIPATGVNIFLYQVTPNGALRNEDVPTRAQDGRVVQRPRIALDLHYLFTFYGRDSQLEPQRLLGSVVRTLHAKPVLTRPQIHNAVAGFPFLTASDLEHDVELVKFTQLPLSLEELSKLWSVFFQTTYTLSVAYQGTVVLIESAESFSSPLPVRLHNVYVETFREPFVERVVATAGDDKPIFSASPIRVLGNRLRGHTTRLVIDGGPDIAPTTTADTELTATLPAALRAGLHGLQVQHRRLMGTPEADHRGVESNIAPFILTPRIKQPGGVYQISLANQISETVDGQVVHSADVTLKIDPDVAKDQRVALLLNEIAATDARTYTFLDEPRALDTDTITVRAVRVKPATYLVRVQVDGADSRLDVTGDTYSDPKVTL
jgi:hypothetical protein